MEELNAKIELQNSRTGNPVPIVDGIYLHSIYNPEKEAQALASNYSDSIKRKSHLLVLGLGFGYHVVEMAKLARKAHDNYRIMVFKPNEELIKTFEQNKGFEDKSITIVHAKSGSEIFNNFDFAMFLTSKPAIIKHEASYNLNKSFFKDFLTFKAPVEIHKYQRLMTPAAKKLFSIKEKSVDQALEDVKRSGKIRETGDYALFAFEAIVKSANQLNRGEK